MKRSITSMSKPLVRRADAPPDLPHIRPGLRKRGGPRHAGAVGGELDFVTRSKDVKSVPLPGQQAQSSSARNNQAIGADRDLIGRRRRIARTVAAGEVFGI